MTGKSILATAALLFLLFLTVGERHNKQLLLIFVLFVFSKNTDRREIRLKAVLADIDKLFGLKKNFHALNFFDETRSGQERKRFYKHAFSSFRTKEKFVSLQLTVRPQCCLVPLY